MITPRENLLRVFRHETPEWIPICGHVDPYNQPNRQGMPADLAASLGTVQWCDESTLLFSRYLGLDIMDYMGPPIRIRRKQVSVECVEQGADTMELWHTPAGTLRQVRRRSREDGTSYLIEHMVKNADDLPLLAAIFQDELVEVDPERRESLEARQALIGDDGILMCFMPGSPLGMMYRFFCSVETLAYLYAEAPESLQDLFDVMETSYRRQYLLSVDSCADALVGMDDTSTTIISPAMFEQFNLDCTNSRCAICHERGKRYFHHSCGLIRHLLPLYKRTRIDAVHAFTVPPIGDVTVREGRAILGGGITVIAGVAPLADASWDEAAMQAGVARLFEGVESGDHFILNLAAYPHKTIEQTRSVVDECKKYQATCRGS